MHPMKVKELGEFALIELLARLVAEEAQTSTSVGEPAGFQLTIGIGDDTAAWRSPQATHLFTTDTLVNGVHFILENLAWQDLGWKSMAVNYSDVAAMGGTPLYSIITLGLPEDTSVEGITDMYRGMLEVCREYGGTIVGGDVIRSPTLFVTVALTGATEGPPMTRAAAVPGDQVAVTGHLGSSAGCLRMQTHGLDLAPQVASRLREAHLRPHPRLVQGNILRQDGVKVAIDVSDGLIDDLSKICRTSQIAALVHADQVPVDPLLKEAFPQEQTSLALSGGEDYELLFTAPQAVMENVCPRLGIAATVIGEIRKGPPGKVTVLDQHGQAMSMASGGWNHFR